VNNPNHKVTDKMVSGEHTLYFVALDHDEPAVPDWKRSWLSHGWCQMPWPNMLTATDIPVVRDTSWMSGQTILLGLPEGVKATFARYEPPGHGAMLTTSDGTEVHFVLDEASYGQRWIFLQVDTVDPSWVAPESEEWSNIAAAPLGTEGRWKAACDVPTRQVEQYAATTREDGSEVFAGDPTGLYGAAVRLMPYDVAGRVEGYDDDTNLWLVRQRKTQHIFSRGWGELRPTLTSLPSFKYATHAVDTERFQVVYLGIYVTWMHVMAWNKTELEAEELLRTVWKPRILSAIEIRHMLHTLTMFKVRDNPLPITSQLAAAVHGFRGVVYAVQQLVRGVVMPDPAPLSLALQVGHGKSEHGRAHYDTALKRGNPSFAPMAEIGTGALARSRTVHHKIRSMRTYASKMKQTHWVELYANTNRGLSLFDGNLLEAGGESRLFMPSFVMLTEAVINCMQLHRHSHTDVEASLRTHILAIKTKYTVLDRVGGSEWGFVSNSARGWEPGRARPSHHFPSSGREWMYCRGDWTGNKTLAQVFADLTRRVRSFTDTAAKDSFASTLVQMSLDNLMECVGGHCHATMVPPPVCAFCNCSSRVDVGTCTTDDIDGMHYHPDCYRKCVSVVETRSRYVTVNII